MKIAIEGCCHGQLDDIYGSIRLLEQKEGIKIDLVLICGDFQAIRNVADLECMAVPRKYLQLGTFHKYYSGAKVVPYPTVFIGGNHEASNYLWELYYGGWAAQNLYFLGWAGVIKFGGVRIAGASGIYKPNHYTCGHYEKAPYSQSDLRSIYHVRQYDIRKLGLLKTPIDIMLTHDWPRGIEQYGDVQKLLRVKKFFREEVARNELGSRANEELLTKLHPKYWFSAHLHVKFAAVVNHDDWMRRNTRNIAQGSGGKITIENPDEIIISMDDDDTTPAANPDEIPVELDEPISTNQAGAEALAAVTGNPDEIVMDDDFDEPIEISSVKDVNEEIAKSQGAPPTHTPISGRDVLINESAEKPPALDTSEEPSKTTKFLSLDKCLPGRQFLQVLDVPCAEENLDFEYDLEWLAITQVTNSFFSLQYRQSSLPNDEVLSSQIDQKVKDLQQKVANGTLDLKIPNNFTVTAPPHDDSRRLTPQEIQSYIVPYANPQTEMFCQMLGMENKFKDSNISQSLPQNPTALSANVIVTDEPADEGSTPPKRPKLDIPPPKTQPTEEGTGILKE